VVAEEEDQQEDRGGVSDDARVPLAGGVAVDASPDPRHRIEVEEKRRQGAERGLRPGQPAQQESEEAHPGVDGLSPPFRARHSSGPARIARYSGKYEAVTGRAVRHYREPLVEYLAMRAGPEL